MWILYFYFKDLIKISVDLYASVRLFQQWLDHVLLTPQFYSCAKKKGRWQFFLLSFAIWQIIWVYGSSLCSTRFLCSVSEKLRRAWRVYLSSWTSSSTIWFSFPPSDGPSRSLTAGSPPAPTFRKPWSRNTPSAAKTWWVSFRKTWIIGFFEVLQHLINVHVHI